MSCRHASQPERLDFHLYRPFEIRAETTLIPIVRRMPIPYNSAEGSEIIRHRDLDITAGSHKRVRRSRRAPNMPSSVTAWPLRSSSNTGVPITLVTRAATGDLTLEAGDRVASRESASGRLVCMRRSTLAGSLG